MPKSCAPVKVLANYSTHARPREILHKLGVLNELSSDQNPAYLVQMLSVFIIQTSGGSIFDCAGTLEHVLQTFE